MKLSKLRQSIKTAKNKPSLEDGDVNVKIVQDNDVEQTDPESNDDDVSQTTYDPTQTEQDTNKEGTLNGVQDNTSPDENVDRLVNAAQGLESIALHIDMMLQSKARISDMTMETLNLCIDNTLRGLDLPSIPAPSFESLIVDQAAALAGLRGRVMRVKTHIENMIKK